MTTTPIVKLCGKGEHKYTSTHSYAYTYRSAQALIQNLVRGCESMSNPGYWERFHCTHHLVKEPSYIYVYYRLRNGDCMWCSCTSYNFGSRAYDSNIWLASIVFVYQLTQKRICQSRAIVRDTYPKYCALGLNLVPYHKAAKRVSLTHSHIWILVVIFLPFFVWNSSQGSIWKTNSKLSFPF